MIVKVFIDKQQLTLYKEEAIEITSQVLDLEDITANTTDYTKEFNVPANENNNKIFKHYYDADIDNMFDARVTVDGWIELDGFVYRVGKFVLRNVTVRQNVAYSYQVNFWGNLVSLKDLLGDDKLAFLDLDFYNHAYRDDQVKTGLTSSLKGGDLVYTLQPKVQYFYDSDAATTSENNIGWNGGAGDNGIKYNGQKPSLKVIKILEQIETEYGITFSRDFFGLPAFQELFLLLNNDDSGQGIAGSPTWITWTSGNNPFAQGTGQYPAQSFQYPTLVMGEEIEYRISCTITPVEQDVTYTLTCLLSTYGEVPASKTGQGNLTIDTILLNRGFGFNPTQEILWVVETADGSQMSYTAQENTDEYRGGGYWAGYQSQAALQTLDAIFEVSRNIPDIEIIEWLKGMFAAYKLVIIPQQDGTIYVDTLESYYDSGGLLDITRYIDRASMEVSRGKILNEINYLFAEPQTIVNQQYEITNNGRAYGDEELKIRDGNGQLLSGDKVDIELPFETILYERLSDNLDGVETNVMYGALIDKKRDPVNPKPVHHYVSNQDVSVKSVAFINGSGVKEEIATTLNIPLHGSTPNAPEDVFLFSQEFSVYDGNAMVNTLFAKYHAEYIADIFNDKRRTYKIKAHLPIGVILKLTLNDVVQIQDKFFRIDNFTVNTLTGESTLTLVNSINIDSSNLQLEIG